MLHFSCGEFAAKAMTAGMEPAEYSLMDAAEDRMWWYRALHVRLCDALRGSFGRILDAGCGTGGFLAALGRARPDLGRFGVEFDPGAAARAKAKSGAYVVRGSINALPFKSQSFDAVVSADVLCHAAVTPMAALEQIRRVLRPGGRVILNLPAYQWMMSAHDRQVHNVRRYSAGTARDLLVGAGFVGVETRYWNGLLLPLMIVQRKILARGEASSDVAPFPPWLDATLHNVTEFERHLPLAMPAGGSVLATAEKP